MESIPQLFEASLKRFGDNPLIREKQEGKYRAVSYREIARQVNRLSLGLLRLGLKKEDRVALLAEGRREWLVAELAILYCSAVVVPLSVRLIESKELRFRLQHAGCRYLIVSGQMLEKARKACEKLPGMEKIICLDDPDPPGQDVIPLEKLMADGEGPDEKLINTLDERWKNIQGNDLATISYTSGTTADPKGIMLTHRNYLANLEQANSLIEVPEWYTTLLILSWDHSFAHTVGLYVMIRNGASIAVLEQGKTQLEAIRNIPVNLREVRPVFMLSVPALARSFRNNIEKGVKSKGKVLNRLFHHALRVSYHYHGNGFDRKTPGQMLLAPLVRLYDLLIFRKIRDGFGGRMKFFIGGGALLDLELQHFFYAIGIPMFQGYGLTEAAPVISSNTPDVHKLGSSGKPVKNLEVRILDEEGKECPQGEKGEIVVQGDNVMAGYWKNREATEETLKKGRLHTGDLGFFDADGFLHVLGRYKSLLIGNDGEKYSPEGIEEAMVNSSVYVAQCMLYNNQHPYTAALVVVNREPLREFMDEKGIDATSEEAARACIQLVFSELERFRKAGDEGRMFPPRWLPAALALLDEPFTERNGMINSTLKMVRSKVADHYDERLEYLFTSEGKNPYNPKNIGAIKRILNKDH
jgi:long-chain acyl-CoA synthetase